MVAVGGWEVGGAEGVQGGEGFEAGLGGSSTLISKGLPGNRFIFGPNDYRPISRSVPLLARCFVNRGPSGDSIHRHVLAHCTKSSRILSLSFLKRGMTSSGGGVSSGKLSVPF